MIPMFAGQEVPNRGVFDLEIARPIPDGKSGRPDWKQAHKCGISTLVMWPPCGL